VASRFWEYSDGKIRRGERQRSENRARIEAVIVDLDGTLVLKIAADAAISIGDTPYDVEAGKRIGLRTILFCGGAFDEETLREAGAIAIYRDPAAPPRA
jgi:phosphoglycolate phosphatase-like HAD superfamily hydrolase